ncbi:MAG: hypothetical protein M1835_004084 [Candelina submexicana]|nr:MAG: hypothetical protein M1835_004084 [Candelina submexicana]
MTEDSTTSAALGTKMDTSESSTKLGHRAIHAEDDVLLRHESETRHRTSAEYTGRLWLREKSKDTPLTSDSSKCFKQYDEFCVGYSGSKPVESLAKRIFTEWLGIPIYVPKSATTRDTKTPTSDAILSCPVPPDTLKYVWKDSYSGYCPARITQTIDRFPKATHSSTKTDNTSSAELSLLYAGPGGVSYLPASQGSVICPTPFDIVTLETSIESTSTTVTISLCPVYQTVTRRAFEPTPTNLERREIPQVEARNTKEPKTFDRMPVPLREFFGCLGDEHKQPWECSVIITQFRTWIKSDNGQEACRGYGVITGKLEDKPRPWKDLLCRLDKYETQTYAEASVPGNSSIAKESSLELLDDSITSFEYWLQTPRGFSDFNAYKKDMVHKINSGKVPIYVEHHKGHQVSSIISGCTPTERITSVTASATSPVRNRFLAARDSILQPAKSLTPRNILHPNEKQIKKCKADANKPLYRKRGVPLVPNILVANLILQPRATTGPVPAVEALLVPDPLGAHCSMIGYREHLMLLLVCLVFLILCALGFVMWYLRRLSRHHHRAQTPEPVSSRERARSIVTVRDPNTFNDIVIPEEEPSRLPSNPQTRNKFLPLPKNGLANWGEKFKRARAEDPENVPPRARIPSAWQNGTVREESIPLKQRLPLGENQVNDRGGEADKPRVVSTGTDRKEGGGSVVHRKGSSQGYGSV